MKIGWKVLVVAASASLLAAAVQAGEGAGHGGGGRRDGAGRGENRGERWDRILEHADANKDEKISLDEFLAKSPILDRLDKNHDGTVEKSELPTEGPRAERAARIFGKLDTNGDGKLTRAEANERRKELFKAMDKNSDGQIAKDEFMSFKPERGQGGDDM